MINPEDTKVGKAEGYDLRIADMLRVAFGYKRLAYGPVPNTTRFNRSRYDNLQGMDFQFEQRSSLLNTPIIMPLKVQVSAKGDPVEYFNFPNEPIVEIRGSKHIVKTKIDGQDGEFKQLWSMDDYQVIIRGIAVDDTTEENYPENIVRQLRKVFELRNHLEVVGPIFTLFNIKYISFESFELVPQPGEQSMVPYQFSALSDKEYKLQLRRKGSTE